MPSTAKPAKAKIGVLGASGYTGSELVRLLLRHPRAELVLLTADRRAGQEMRAVFPQFSPFKLPKLVSIDDTDWKKVKLDLAFCALPHATTQKVIADLLDQGAEDQGGGPFGGLPARRHRGLCEVVRPRAPRAEAAARGGVRAGRGLSRQDQEGAPRRQSRLLHELRAASAHAAAQGQGDRSRRDRDRRQVRHDRGGALRQGGDAVLRGVGGHPRLRRRAPPPYGGARPGVLDRRRPERRGDLHAASDADEPRHPVDHLRARRARANRPKTFTQRF